MKTFILFFFPAIFFSQTTYQNGFSAGYQAGYCHGVISGCVSPVAPIGPVDIKNDYQTGYNNGFVAGKQQQQTNNTNSGGAYGQLKPTDNKVGEVYQNMIDNMVNSHNQRLQAEEDLKKEEANLVKKINNSIDTYKQTITSWIFYITENKIETSGNNAEINKFIGKLNYATELFNSRSGASKISDELANKIYNVVLELKYDIEYSAKYGELKKLIDKK